MKYLSSLIIGGAFLATSLSALASCPTHIPCTLNAKGTCQVSCDMDAHDIYDQPAYYFDVPNVAQGSQYNCQIVRDYPLVYIGVANKPAGSNITVQTSGSVTKEIIDTTNMSQATGLASIKMLDSEASDAPVNVT